MNIRKTEELMELLNKKIWLDKKRLNYLMDDKNIDINMVGEEGFGLLFRCVHDFEYQDLLKKVFKRKDLDTSANVDDTLMLLAAHNNHKYFRIILDKNKELIVGNVKSDLETAFESYLDGEHTHWTPLKSYLYYLSVVENKISKRNIKKYYNLFKGMTYQEINEYFK
jgi:hypothetical protein